MLRWPRDVAQVEFSRSNGGYAETQFFGIVIADTMGLTSTNFDVIVPKVIAFGEITQNNGHYAAQGNSRSTLRLW